MPFAQYLIHEANSLNAQEEGKMETLNQVQPKVGMSVSMGIGSDSYHEIIVRMERNSKTIYTMSARIILGGVALEDWNALPESIKAKRAADAMQDQAELFKREFPTMREGWAEEQQISCYTYRATGRRAGRYAAKGGKYCWITLDCQHEYLDPSF
jgi:hypothetical protein